MNTQGFTHPHIGYCNAPTYHKAELVCDIIYRLCHWPLERCDCTIDQMIQAARANKQHGAGGIAFSDTSKEAELKLVNTAPNSPEKLPNEHKNYSHVSELQLWVEKHKQAIYGPNRGCKLNLSYEESGEFATTYAEVVLPSIAICLSYQANYPLGRLKQDFLNEMRMCKCMRRTPCSA